MPTDLPTEADRALDLAAHLDALARHGGDRPGAVYRGYCVPHHHAAAIRRALAAEAEVDRLRGIINGMAARITAQSELLSKRAEKGTT